MNMLLDLPYELLLNIVEYLYTNELKSIILVNKKEHVKIKQVLSNIRILNFTDMGDKEVNYNLKQMLRMFNKSSIIYLPYKIEMKNIVENESSIDSRKIKIYPIKNEIISIDGNKELKKRLDIICSEWINECKKDKDVYYYYYERFIKHELKYDIDEWKNDKKILKYMLERIEKDYYEKIRRIYVKDLPGEWKNDKGILLYMIEKDINHISEIHDSLKKDKDFMYEAFMKNIKCLEYMDDLLKKDKEYILNCIKKMNGHVKLMKLDIYNKRDNFIFNSKTLYLTWLENGLKDDKDIVLEAIEGNGYNLKDASDNLKNNKDVVIKAVKKNGYNLQYASESLRLNEEVVLLAIKNNSKAFQFASESLKLDKEFIKKAVKENHKSIQYIDEKSKKDKNFLNVLYMVNNKCLKYITQQFKYYVKIRNKRLELYKIKYNKKKYK